MILLQSAKNIINDSEQPGLTWYEIASQLELTTGKLFNEQAIRQLIHDTKTKIKKVYGDKKIEIIKNVNGRYVVCKKVALISPSKR